GGAQRHQVDPWLQRHRARHAERAPRRSRAGHLMLAMTLAAVLTAGMVAGGEPSRGAPLPESALAVRTAAGWRVWWRSSRPTDRWSEPDPILTEALRWQRAARGVRWSEVELAGSGEAYRTRVVVVELDPNLVRFDLDTAFTRGGERADWAL